MSSQFYVFSRKSQGINLALDNTTKMLYTDKVSVVAVDVSASLQRHNSSSLGDSEWVARFIV